MHERRNDRDKTDARRCHFFFAVLWLVTGCQAGEHNTAFANYLDKLAQALPGPAPVEAGGERPRSDHAVFHPIDINAGDHGAVDILDLRGCALKRTVIREQSRLGKAAKPSQRLLLILEYLHLAPGCVRQLRQQGDNPLADSLERTWEERRRDLPAYIFNATLGSDEYWALWASESFPMGFPRLEQSTVVSALAAIDRQSIRWLGGDYRIHDRNFELLLGEVAGGAGGVLLQSLHAQSEALAGADHRLRSQLRRDPLCDTPNNPRESVRLMTAARHSFYANILPDFRKSSAHMAELLAPVAALEKRLDHVLPTEYLRWRANRERQIRDVQKAPSRHLGLLTRVERACAGR